VGAQQAIVVGQSVDLDPDRILNDLMWYIPVFTTIDGCIYDMWICVNEGMEVLYCGYDDDENDDV
jgi:hypothetical protein